MVFRHLAYGVMFLVFLTNASAFSACGKRSVELDRSTRNMIDTISARQISVLRLEMDSLCEAKFDSLVRVAVDSILEVRMAEIHKVLKQ